MIGWRGASRYYHEDYKDGFVLELEAVKRVREKMGLTNLKLMIPFCRTPEEGRRVRLMKEHGLSKVKTDLRFMLWLKFPQMYSWPTILRDIRRLLYRLQ